MTMIASKCLLPGPLLDLFQQRQEATALRRLGVELIHNDGSFSIQGPGVHSNRDSA